MVRCQEMSQIEPTITLVDANATAQSGHGTTGVADAAVPVARSTPRHGAGGRRWCEG